MKNNGFLKKAMASKTGRGIALALGMTGVAATTGCSIETCVGDSYECDDTVVIVDAPPEIICHFRDGYGDPYTEVTKVHSAYDCDIVNDGYGNEVACFDYDGYQVTEPGDYPYPTCDYFYSDEPGYRNLSVGATSQGLKVMSVGTKPAAGAPKALSVRKSAPKAQ